MDGRGIPKWPLVRPIPREGSAAPPIPAVISGPSAAASTTDATARPSAAPAAPAATASTISASRTRPRRRPPRRQRSTIHASRIPARVAGSSASSGASPSTTEPCSACVTRVPAVPARQMPTAIPPAAAAARTTRWSGTSAAWMSPASATDQRRTRGEWHGLDRIEPVPFHACRLRPLALPIPRSAIATKKATNAVTTKRSRKAYLASVNGLGKLTPAQRSSEHSPVSLLQRRARTDFVLPLIVSEQ